MAEKATDIAVLGLVKVKGRRREPLAKALSTLRRVAPDHTVYGVRWTARVIGTGGLDPYGIFMAVRGSDLADLEHWWEEIDGILHPPKPLTKKAAKSKPQLAMLSMGAPPIPEDVDGLDVEEFYRDGQVEMMQHNGLP